MSIKKELLVLSAEFSRYVLSLFVKELATCHGMERLICSLALTPQLLHLC